MVAAATPATSARLAEARAAAEAVPDPELVSVTVADLGILREVYMDGDDVAVAVVTPTYAGCPAVPVIERDIERALRAAGFDARIERRVSPPWTTDWITPAGRAKLLASGIVPPAEASSSKRSLFGETRLDCPRCQSRDTERISEFGATACKALYRCRACGEPFEYFKCL